METHDSNEPTPDAIDVLLSTSDWKSIESHRAHLLEVQHLIEGKLSQCSKKSRQENKNASLWFQSAKVKLDQVLLDRKRIDDWMRSKNRRIIPYAQITEILLSLLDYRNLYMDAKLTAIDKQTIEAHRALLFEVFDRAILENPMRLEGRNTKIRVQ